MARYRKKKPFYEVVGKPRSSFGYSREVERLRSEKSGGDKPDVKAPKTPLVWSRRPRLLQLSAGRVEMSIPYPLAIAVLLGIVLLGLVVFRFGQAAGKGQNAAGVGVELPASAEKVGEAPAELADLQIRQPMETGGPVVESAAAGSGDNVIVMVQYPVKADLIPVQEHFAEYGIGTEIIREGDWYFLVTKDRYNNPEKAGTDGYKAKQKIIEVGAKYKNKAPEGYETFAPHFFKDAYGRKVQ